MAKGVRIMQAFAGTCRYLHLGVKRNRGQIRPHSAANAGHSVRVHFFLILLIALVNRRQFRRNWGDSMNLGDILTSDNILPDMAAANRWEAIDELVQQLVNTGKVQRENREAIVGVVKKRESSMSTGIGFGIGIPHASTDLIQEVVGALGRSKKGIEFDALDNQPVNLVVLFLVPQGQFQKHLHTLASIAKLLHVKEFRQELEQAGNAAEMFEIIKKYSASK
jgi:mannitol/fructose-specific phosphotransferase system IIA component (Ntr-type)